MFSALNTGFKYHSSLDNKRQHLLKKSLIDTIIHPIDSSKKPIDTLKKPIDTLKKGVTDTVIIDSNRNMRKVYALSGGMKIDSSINDIVSYHAKDSIPSLVKPTIAEFYGDVVVKYQDFELNAAYVRWDKEKDILYARGNIDPKSKKYIDRPVFKSKEQGTVISDSIYYNLKTAKAKIYNPFTEQQGGFFSHGISKKQEHNEVHLKDVVFSTCNLPHPHFGIHISKGIVTENQIITGPAYFEFEGLPLPLGIPFGFFPKPNKRASGIIFPQFGEDYTRGFFARDFGYYLGLSDYWDATIKASIFTRGSYEAAIDSRYLKRYKYNGSISFRYANGRYGLEGTPQFARQQDFNLTWSHSQNANAHPGTTFSASVNAGTSSFLRNTAAPTTDISQLARNNLSSSISYGKVFAKGLMNLSASFTHRQEISQKTISLELPNISFNVSSFSPFKTKTSIGDKWYEKINMSYSLQASNSISARESELFKQGSFKKFNTSFVHAIPISTNFNVLKYFNFNVGASYNERWYFQTIRKRFFKNPSNSNDSTLTDTVSGFERAGNYSIGGGFTTKIYSTLAFKKGKIKAIRYLLTPSFSFSYSPDFTAPNLGYYRNAFYEDTKAPVLQNLYNGSQQLKYSIFEGSRAGLPGGPKNASINLSLDNTVEVKIRVKDTTGRDSTAIDGFIDKKIPIIQGLNISGSYNFVSPSYKLSDFGFSGRTQLSEKFGISFNGNFSPYALKDSLVNGNLYSERIDRYVWNDGNGFKLPRLTSVGFSFQYSLNPDFFKKRNAAVDQVRKNTLATADPNQREQLRQISLDPNYFVDFNIPWNLSFSYNFNYSKPTNLKSNTTNTVGINGDLNVTPKWKVTYNSGYDFVNKVLTYPNLGIYRDLHCWDMSIHWVPFGYYASYSIDIAVKAPILQDLKISKRKGYYTKF